MNARDDENYYRIENAKAFLEAVGTSEAALKNVSGDRVGEQGPKGGGVALRAAETPERRVFGAGRCRRKPPSPPFIGPPGPADVNRRGL